jgi:hypothetical protein
VVKPQVPHIAVHNLNEMEDALRLDPETTDARFIYRFVGDNPRRMARHRMKRYVPVTVDDQVKLLCPEMVDDRGDGLIRVGDTILMKCPKEVVAARQESFRMLGEAKLKRPKQRMKKLGKVRKGIKVINEEE